MSKPRELLFAGGTDTQEARSRLRAWLERVESAGGFMYDPNAEFRHAAKARDRRDARVTFPYEDHRRCWRKSGVGVLYTSQPRAELSERVLAEMKAACDRHTLALITSREMSWHEPGQTILVVAARREILDAVGLSPQ